MPSIASHVLASLEERAMDELSDIGDAVVDLMKRVNIPINSTTPPQLIAAVQQDPWAKSGKYGLAWIYFGLALLVVTTTFRLYNYWGDRIRTALYKDEVIQSAIALSASTPTPQDPYASQSAQTESSHRVFFPSTGPLVQNKFKQQSKASTIAPLNNIVAFFRYIFYRPVPQVRIGKWRFTSPSPGTVVIVLLAFAFSMLYCFLPQPLFYSTIAYGSPPLAIRAGMMAIALVPWIAVLATKANPISLLTGIGHERLIVLHRWGAYLCTTLAIIHAVPYWYQSTADPQGFLKFKLYFIQHYYIFTTGISAFAPLLFLVIHSLPIIRYRFYEVFVLCHIPVAWAFIGLLFWHTKNYLNSWAYLFSTLILLIGSLIVRLFYLNWMNPLSPSWLIGEESAVTILPENAVKVTIPTQRRWKPGQYAYLRMPGVSVVENHPFTIASLCSEDFPSEYGDRYRDMTMVFRPFGGFTRDVFNTALQKGPYKTYRSFIEGPYGGMQRQMASFDQVIFFAGGSGITAIASQLVDLVKRMRDGKATTRSVHVIWAMKRPEIMEWFKEELKICREYAPTGSVHCHFFITSAKRYDVNRYMSNTKEGQRLSQIIGEKVDDVMRSVGNKRNSNLIEDHMDFTKGEDVALTALPQPSKAHLSPPVAQQPYFPPPPTRATKATAIDTRQQTISTLAEVQSDAATMAQVDRLYNAHRLAQSNSPQNSQKQFMSPQSQFSDWSPQPPAISPEDQKRAGDFKFGFPQSPTEYQKSLMRFAYLPDTKQPIEPEQAYHQQYQIDVKDYQENHDYSPIESKNPHSFPLAERQFIPHSEIPHGRIDGWRTQYGRPDIPFMLKNLASEFSRRTCIYVCGPAEMRCTVASTVAGMQKLVWTDPNRDEIFMHAENYAI